MKQFWFNRMDDPIQEVDTRSFEEQFAEIMGTDDLPIVVEDNGGYKGISSQGDCWLYIDEYNEDFLFEENALSSFEIEVIEEIRENEEEEVRMRRAEAINAMLEIFKNPSRILLAR